MVINLSKEHSLVSNWVAELRDVTIQGDRMRFRRNLERIGEVAAFEISRKLPYVEKEIQTPLGTAVCEVLEEQPVLTTILRAGLALHNGLLSYFGTVLLRLHYNGTMFSACGPFWPCVTVNSTFWPSASVLKPGTEIAR